VTFIEQAKKSDYKYMSPIQEKYNPSELIISIFIDCYYGLDLVKQSIQSVLDQDYQNVELVLVDNGAKEDVSRYLYDIYTKHKNTALIKFKENQFSWEDVEITVVTCWNSAVLHCNGDVVAHLSYDDMLSYDYASRMVKLFSENKNCVTAAPLPVSIDIDGKINKEISEKLRAANSRSTYINGKKLAIDLLKDNSNSYFSSPGDIMAIKKNLLIQYGGYDRLNDATQVLKFSIHGDSGFDPEAKLFWRHHVSQVNKQQSAKNITLCGRYIDDIKDSGLIALWEELFSEQDVNILNQYIRKTGIRLSFFLVSGSIRRKDAIGFLHSIRNIYHNCPNFLFYVIALSFLELLEMVKSKFNKKSWSL
jgi:glycosyltransferase involved in cell wall biosynthesis